MDGKPVSESDPPAVYVVLTASLGCVEVMEGGVNGRGVVVEVIVAGFERGGQTYPDRRYTRTC